MFLFFREKKEVWASVDFILWLNVERKWMTKAPGRSCARQVKRARFSSGGEDICGVTLVLVATVQRPDGVSLPGNDEWIESADTPVVGPLSSSSHVYPPWSFVVERLAELLGYKKRNEEGSEYGGP